MANWITPSASRCYGRRLLSVSSLLRCGRFWNRRSRIVPVTRAFAEVAVTEMIPQRRTPLRYRDHQPSHLWVEPFLVPAGPPGLHPGM